VRAEDPETPVIDHHLLARRDLQRRLLLPVLRRCFTDPVDLNREKNPQYKNWNKGKAGRATNPQC
jgi:hypothetical protein